MTPENDIRDKALAAHSKAHVVLDRGTQQDCEQHRDECEECKNAVQTVINACENRLDELRREKRAIDDQMADVRKVQREYEGYKADLATAVKRLNNQYWDMRKSQKVYDPHAG